MHDQLKKIRRQLKKLNHVAPPAQRQSKKEFPSNKVEPDDLALFRKAVEKVKPLPTWPYVIHPPRQLPPVPRQRIVGEKSALTESLHEYLTLEDRFEGGDEPYFLRPGLALRTIHDLKRGRWIIEQELDLHGFTREQAKIRLLEFLNQSRRHGIQLIRIIHGKGLGSPGRQGLLRILVRNWLIQRDEVLAFCHASRYDGGEGALIVLLSSPR